MKSFFTMIAHWTDRLDIGGWLLLFCGALIVGSLILVPEWLKNHDFQTHRDRLRQQLAQAVHQRSQAESMLVAFDQADPSLLKRLAWHQLRWQPTDVEPLTAMSSTPPSLPDSTTRSMIRRWTISSSEAPLSTTPSVPSPSPQRVTYDYQEAIAWLRPIFDKPRPWTLAFGGWLFLLSLWLTPSKPSKEATAAQ